MSIDKSKILENLDFYKKETFVDKSYINEIQGFEQLSIQESKQSRFFKSYKDMISEIRKQLKIYSISKSLNRGSDIESDKKIKATVTSISQVLLKTCDVAVKKVDEDYNRILFIQDPRTNLMTSEPQYFEQLITDISSDQIMFSDIEINQISQFAKDVMSKMKNDSTVRDFVDLPTSYSVMKNKIVVNLKDKSLLSFDEISKNYDIVSTNAVNYVFDELFNEEENIQRAFYRQIIDRVMTDWSKHDKQVENLLWQMMYSVIQGDNHGKFFVLKGPGGNGKSTFMYVLTKFVGPKHVRYANIHQFGDPNSINKFDMTTRVIVGDDAATNHKLNDNALSNLKSIITGDPLSVPMKYSDNVIVITRGLFVQGTNTDISFYENNPAIKSRVSIINWSTTDFRSNKPSDITFDLDNLIENQSFIDEWASMCIEKIDYFTKFDIPQSVIEATNQLIESTDTINQFLVDNITLVDGYESLPLYALYTMYDKWCQKTNPGGGVLKFANFKKSLVDKSNKFNYSIDDSRKRFTKHQNKESIKIICQTNDDVFSIAQPSVNFKNIIKEEEINEFLSHHHNDLNDREIQIVTRLIHDNKNTEVASTYGSLI